MNLETLNNLLCHQTQGLGNLGPILAQFPQILKTDESRPTLGWLLHLSKASFDVKCLIEDFEYFLVSREPRIG